MKDNGQNSFVQAYNAQIVVDSQAQVIVAAELTQQTTDRRQLLPMVKSLRDSAQGAPETITADAGYWDTCSLLDPLWRALQEIPFGKTLSYGEIAKQLGRPTANRAVGAANGRNPISIVVPCHRVIGSSGKLTGFAGGLDAKAHLLNLEASNRISV
jgi:O-6-methylguanine DNA methyltransferase